MATITNEDEFKAWLEGKPRDWAVVLAARSALRVLPLVGTWRTVDDREIILRDAFVLVTFRAVSAAWASAKCPEHHSLLSASSGSASGPSYRASRSQSDFLAASRAALAASNATAASSTFSTPIGISAAERAANSAISASFDAVSNASFDIRFPERMFWAAISLDATFLERSNPVKRLAGLLLWPGAQPSLPLPQIMSSHWNSLKYSQFTSEENWDVWTDWYEGRLVGRRVNRKDLEVFRVTLDNAAADGMFPERSQEDWAEALREHDADWDKGPAHVNALIKARMRQVSRPQPASATPLSVPFQLGAQSVETRSFGSASSPVTNRKLRTRRPKSPTARAVSARSDEIRMQIFTLSEAIDNRIAELETHHGLNDLSEVEELKLWRCLLAEIEIAIDALQVNGNEEKVEKIIGVLKEVIIDYLRTHGKSAVNLGVRSLIFSGVVSIGAMAGVAWPAALIAGIMVGGKPVKDTIEAVWGETKATFGKLPWSRKADEK